MTESKDEVTPPDTLASIVAGKKATYRKAVLGVLANDMLGCDKTLANAEATFNKAKTTYEERVAKLNDLDSRLDTLSPNEIVAALTILGLSSPSL